ncbi:uncharacterized protein [Miscanthus floridulus]|uniref:uncharacterized protein n=1 Tax=Miscanthus floridulus TaxID=154761 RepID=UPI003458269B
MAMADKLDPEAAGAGSAMTEIELTDGYRLEADVIASDSTGRPLLAPDKNQLADVGKGALYGQCSMRNDFPWNICICQSFHTIFKPGGGDDWQGCNSQATSCLSACLEVSSDSGISAYSKHATKSMGVCQVWLFLLIILASSKQVLSSAEAKREGEEIGTCRFDLTSVATLSCVEPDGNWRPPSVSCCEALLYAIDNLPARNESGACCLCRYLSKKYSSHGLALATSYVLCQGKDSHIVTAWSSLAHNCYRVCRRQGNASAYGMGTPVVKVYPDVDVEGTQSDFKMLLWITIIGAAVFCAMFLVLFCYHWRHRPMPSSLQNQGLPSEIRDERRPSGKKSSAHRRMSSSRGSPNG